MSDTYTITIGHKDLIALCIALQDRQDRCERNAAECSDSEADRKTRDYWAGKAQDAERLEQTLMHAPSDELAGILAGIHKPSLPELPILNTGKRFISDDPTLFDTLNQAGLLKKLGTDKSHNGTHWPVWGITHEDAEGTTWTEFEIEVAR